MTMFLVCGIPQTKNIVVLTLGFSSLDTEPARIVGVGLQEDPRQCANCRYIVCAIT